MLFPFRLHIKCTSLSCISHSLQCFSPAKPAILLKVEDIFVFQSISSMCWLNYFAFGVHTSHIYLFTYTKLLKCKTVLEKLAGRI